MRHKILPKFKKNVINNNIDNFIEQITDLHTQNAMRCPTQFRLATITQQPDRQTVLQTVKQCLCTAIRAP